MAGLVGYGSSDEEEDPSSKVLPARGNNIASRSKAPSSSHGVDVTLAAGAAESDSTTERSLLGPMQGPTIPVEPIVDKVIDDAAFEPQSPYSADRAILHELLMPSVPNFDIPASPPGSPLASTAAKVRQFLNLKAESIHFHDKISQLSRLKDPAIFEQLMDFAGLKDAEQYATTLPQDFWDPNGFPEHAYWDELEKAALDAKYENQRKQGEAVGFVSSNVPAETRNGKVGSASTAPKSTAERIMAGVDRSRTSSPHVTGKRKSRFGPDAGG